MQQELEAMRKALVIRNYATKTVDTYVSVLRRFLEQLDKPIKDVTPADIQAWQYVMVNDRKISWSLFNQMVCALRFYFQKVRDCDWPVDRIPFQRRRKRLPSVLSREEVARLLNAARHNPKHHAILSTLYSTGLRVGELVKLRIPDIDSRAMLVHVRQGKGGGVSSPKTERCNSAPSSSWCCEAIIAPAWSSRKPGCSRERGSTARWTRAASSEWFPLSPARRA